MTPAIRRTSVTESQPLGAMLIPSPLSPLPRRAAGAAHVVRSRRRIAGGGPLDNPLSPLPRRAAVSAHQVRTKSRIAGGGPLDDPLGPLPRRAAVAAHQVRSPSRIAGRGCGEKRFRLLAQMLEVLAESRPAPIVFDDARISPEVSDEIACPGYVETVRAIHNIIRGRECRLRKASSQRP